MIAHLLTQVQYSQLVYFCPLPCSLLLRDLHQPPNNHTLVGQINAEDKWGKRWAEVTFKSCFSPRVTRQVHQQVSGVTLSLTLSHTCIHTITRMLPFNCGSYVGLNCHRTLENHLLQSFNPKWRPWSQCAASSCCSRRLAQTSCSVSRFVSAERLWETSRLVHVHKGTVRSLLFQDEPECLKYFYKEKVPAWGTATSGATRLCQRFVNRCLGSGVRGQVQAAQPPRFTFGPFQSHITLVAKENI